jgi:hypothetical protein
MGRLLSSIVLLALVAACGDPCRDLGEELCRCAPAGTSRDTCERQVKDTLESLSPNADQEQLCEDKLAACEEPDGASFCEWLDTSCGKARCGLSVEDPGEVCP